MKITQLEAQVLNHKQLKKKHEERIKELTKNQQELEELLIQSQQTNKEPKQEKDMIIEYISPANLYSIAIKLIV